MMNELPTIECNCWDSDLGFGRVCKNCKVLLAHETHAKEMLDEHHRIGCSYRDCDIHSYWRGRLEAIQALKGEVKE